MKKLLLTAALSIAATVAITACAVQEPVDINSMSLEKTSPFETPTPKAYGENAGLYRETQMGMQNHARKQPLHHVPRQSRKDRRG